MGSRVLQQVCIWSLLGAPSPCSAHLDFLPAEVRVLPLKLGDEVVVMDLCRHGCQVGGSLR